MKKNKLILVAIVLLAAATSCSKEQITMNTSNGSTNSNEMLSSQLDADGKVISEKADERNYFRRVWRDNGGLVDGRDFGCFGYGGNCLDEVVVVGIVGPIGDLELANPNNYVKLLQDNTAEFTNFLPEEMIQKVISGNAQLSTKGSIIGGVLYVIFSEQEEVSLVVPFKSM
ncbi:MAG: hypothetical protein ACI9XP_000704 [Lentimonas sp.]|jgi:hypothetical protein